MTLFTSAIPVWLNITCGECGNHQDHQLSPEKTLEINNQEMRNFTCSECGSSIIGKINVDGSSNSQMKTLEEVRAE